MAFWPRDQRYDTSADYISKEKRRNYPNLEHGLIGAATLSEDDSGRLSWIFANVLSCDTSGHCEKRLKLTTSVQICSSSFASNRSLPVISTRQRAEQSANFLRTYMPDVEVPENLIRDQLIEETNRFSRLQRFDPYLGNLVDALKTKTDRDSVTVAFASGKNLQSLSYGTISCLQPSPFSSADQGVLKSFPTPIQHVACSKPNNDFIQGLNIAVRTYGSTEVLKVSYTPARQPSATKLATITRNALNNESIIDMKHSIDSLQVSFVGDRGSILAYDISSGKENLFHRSFETANNGDNFWRLALGSSASDYLLMSKKKVGHIDKRTDSSSILLALPSGRDVFSSIENSRADNTLLLCTTSKVVWMDMRFPNIPLLTYAHRREFDRYLAAQTIHASNSTPTTIVTSRSNNMITVYDVARSSKGMTSLNASPYCLSSNQTMYQGYIGQQLVDQGDFVVLMQLTEREGLMYNELRPMRSELVCEYTAKKPNVQPQFKTNIQLQSGIDPLASQECSQVDLSAAYRELFNGYSDTHVSEDENMPACMRLLDNVFLSSYTPDEERPAGHVITIRDILARISDNDSKMRANFLADLSIDSRGSYEALKQEKISPVLINAPWHVSLIPTLMKFDTTISAITSQTEERLEKFKLSHCKDNVRQYEDHARHELVVDLALSFDGFRESLPSKSNELDQTLEVMTGALSLGDGPPPVEFGFLQPVDRTTLSYDDDDVQSPASLDIPLGVRLLLQGWDSFDPEKFIYRDPYNSSNEVTSLVKFKTPLSQSQSLGAFGLGQHPPQILPSNPIGFAEPVTFRNTVPKVLSQSQMQSLPDLSNSGTVDSQSNFSQNLVASTQVLPGPHGGRPTTKKKPAKKRVGGF